MEGAQRRFRDANRKLDEAIYADHLDETVINERIREVQLSQADLVKLRSTNELSIRKILTPGQLNRFRRLRQSFEEANARPGRQFMQRPDPENRPPIRHD